MKVWNVKSAWSEEMVIAPSLLLAREKYIKNAKKEMKGQLRELSVSPEPEKIELLGNAI